MKPYYEREGVVIYNCDCREVGTFIQECSVDSIVTDPPYGLSFMGKGWDHGVPGVEFWSLFSEVCKPGAMMLAFGGTRTFHRLACAIEDAGWEIRDCINWLYGSGFPKSLDISKAIDKAAGAEREKVAGSKSGGMAALNNGNAAHGYRESAYYDDGNMIISNVPATASAKQWQGWGTALKPAWEPITVAMKPLDGTFAANALKHGVAGLNIDGCRVAVDPAVDDMLREVERKPRESQTWEQGSGFKNETNSRTGVPAIGRFPANVIHDGSDEVLAGFPQQTSGANPTRRGSPKFRNAYGEFEGQEECVAARGSESGSAARFFYCAKASRSERGSRSDKALPLFRESETGFTNTHPTVKPLALMEYLLQLVSTPTGGLVLDPFMGSGSTLVAAKALGRKAIGIEVSKEYCDIAIARLSGI